MRGPGAAIAACELPAAAAGRGPAAPARRAARGRRGPGRPAGARRERRPLVSGGGELRAAGRRTRLTRTPRPLLRFPRPKTCPARSSRRRPRVGATTRAARSSSGARTRASGRIRRGRRRAGTSSGSARARRCPTIRGCRWPRSSSSADFYSHWPFERRIGRSFAYGRVPNPRSRAVGAPERLAGTTGGCSNRPARWRTPAARSRGGASSRATACSSRRARRPRSSRRLDSDRDTGSSARFERLFTESSRLSVLSSGGVEIDRPGFATPAAILRDVRERFADGIDHADRELRVAGPRAIVGAALAPAADEHPHVDALVARIEGHVIERHRRLRIEVEHEARHLVAAGVALGCALRSRRRGADPSDRSRTRAPRRRSRDPSLRGSRGARR